MPRYLIVANQTLMGEHLLEKINECMARGSCQLHLLVPASPVPGFWSEGQARAAAQARLDEALARLQEFGVEATGEVGDVNPVHATLDVLREGDFDEVVLSTLPAGLSKWLHQDVPHRLARACNVPVVHVVADRVASQM